MITVIQFRVHDAFLEKLSLCTLQVKRQESKTTQNPNSLNRIKPAKVTYALGRNTIVLLTITLLRNSRFQN